MPAPNDSDSKPSLPRLRLVLADDSSRSLRALAALLESYPDLLVVGQARDGAAAINLITQQRPDVAIVDLRRPGLDSVEVTIQIKRRWSDVRVLVLALDGRTRTSALGAGADAFAIKGEPEDALIEQIRRLGGSSGADRSMPSTD